MNATTLLHRQVNPAWIQSGRVTSQAFKPTAKDNRRLSVYDGDKINAADAWQHYTGSLCFSSAGVITVRVDECQSLELESESDPTPFPEHAVIIFGEFSNAETEKKAKQLKAFALARGWQFQAETDTK
jgi:hypothetical protein